MAQIIYSENGRKTYPLLVFLSRGFQPLAILFSYLLVTQLTFHMCTHQRKHIFPGPAISERIVGASLATHDSSNCEHSASIPTPLQPGYLSANLLFLYSIKQYTKTVYYKCANEKFTNIGFIFLYCAC